MDKLLAFYEQSKNVGKVNIFLQQTKKDYPNTILNSLFYFYAI